MSAFLLLSSVTFGACSATSVCDAIPVLSAKVWSDLQWKRKGSLKLYHSCGETQVHPKTTKYTFSTESWEVRGVHTVVRDGA